MLVGSVLSSLHCVLNSSFCWPLSSELLATLLTVSPVFVLPASPSQLLTSLLSFSVFSNWVSVTAAKWLQIELFFSSTSASSVRILQVFNTFSWARFQSYRHEWAEPETLIRRGCQCVLSFFYCVLSPWWLCDLSGLFSVLLPTLPWDRSSLFPTLKKPCPFLFLCSIFGCFPHVSLFHLWRGKLQITCKQK